LKFKLPTHMPTDEKKKATVELLVASVIWGFGFVATVWALEEFSPIGFMSMRFALAWMVGELLRYLFFSTQGAFFSWEEFKISAGAGLLMASFLLPQTIGLIFTTATNSGFLTILYVILVPLLSWVLFRTKHALNVYLLASIAFVGAFLLMGAQLTGFNLGDLWTLLCAFMAALHILYVGRVSHKIQDSFRFNNYQSLWCLIAVLPLIPLDPQFSYWASGVKPWVGLMATAFGSSLLGFMIQIRAQKVLSDTTASQLFLLESPFAMLFGYLLLSEQITPLKLSGAFLILLSSYITLRLERDDGSTKSKALK
jgi:drug/metabolite transporter (DMT)-like permease